MATKEPTSRMSNTVAPDRVTMAMNQRMASGRPLGANTPIGTVVGFKEYLEEGDDRYRGVVLEDRGDNVLVANMNSTLALGNTNVYTKKELVSLGVEKDDGGKISRADAIAPGDTQRIAFTNGNVVSITHRSGSIPSYRLDVRRGAYTSNGEYEVYYNTQGVSKNEALRRLKRELNRIAGI